MRIVVTGSSSGIGKALVEHLLAKGHEVWGIARSDQSAFARLYQALFHPVGCDVSNWAEVAKVSDEIGQNTQGIDALIACAGTQGAIGPAIEVDPVQWSQTVRSNLDATFFTFRAFYPLLLRTARRSKVICFSGGGATKPRPNFSAYAAAKTAIVRLVENLAEELRDKPIDINAVAPGAITTAMTHEVLALGPDKVGAGEYAAALKQKQTGGSSLANVTGLIEFLLCAQSDGISGRLISAPWDPWTTLDAHAKTIANTDIYTLRRILPEERGHKF